MPTLTTNSYVLQFSYRWKSADDSRSTTASTDLFVISHCFCSSVTKIAAKIITLSWITTLSPLITNVRLSTFPLSDIFKGRILKAQTFIASEDDVMCSLPVSQFVMPLNE